jgi:hypothetical protein
VEVDNDNDEEVQSEMVEAYPNTLCRENDKVWYEEADGDLCDLSHLNNKHAHLQILL